MTKKITTKIFYAGLFRFQTLVFLATIVPALALKILLLFQNVHQIEPVINFLLLFGFAFSIVGGCLYILSYYSSVNKTLEPVARMAEVGELAARVAHDIRGPLSGISAVLEYLHSIEEKNKDLLNNLNLLELSSKRLRNVSDDLLKKYQGKEEETDSFDLHQILDELIGEYMAQPVLKGVCFRKHYAVQSILLSGKRNRIERMFGNVIKNAIEAMNFEGIITVKTAMSERKILATIQDTGPGLNNEKIGKILEGGFTEGKKDGHGIGLTLVKEVLAEHGGLLAIESSPGNGCLFRFTFPEPSDLSTLFSMSVQGESVLVLDDDAIILEQWRRILEDKNIKVETFLSYDDFIQSNPDSKMRTAIVDYHFENSEWNGVQIVEDLKNHGLENIYLCSGEYWKPSLKKKAEELGVLICPKPLPKIVVSYSKIEKKPHRLTATHKAETQNLGYTVLVIDDDETIRLAWELMDRKLQIQKLHTFANLEAMEGSIDLAMIDIAFVDKNIDNSGFTGAQVLEYLKAKGIPKIILASGENSDTLRDDPQFAAADFVIQEKIPQSFKNFFS